LSIAQNVAFDLFRFFADRAGNRSNLAAQQPAAPCHADYEEMMPRSPRRTAKHCFLLHVAPDAVKMTKSRAKAERMKV
jgi:hypothetical protein